MSYIFKIEEVLNRYDEVLYKLIQLKIKKSEYKFEHGALSYTVDMSDGVNSVDSFVVRISPDGLELIVFFTVDAFAAFTDKGNAHIYYGGSPIGIIEEIDLQNIKELPIAFNNIPHQVADDFWLSQL